MRKLIPALLALLSLQATAQYKKAFEDLFQQTPGWPRSGWLAGVGATYTFPVNRKLNDAELLSGAKGSLKTYSAPGIYAELGRWHLVPSGIVFNNLDYSVAYKEINYRQEFTGTDRNGAVLTDKAAWQDQNLSVNFNLNSVIQFADYQWLMPSLGIHGDYRLGGKRSYSPDSANFNYVLPNQKLDVGLHVKIAYGLKLTSELFIVPSFQFDLLRLNDLNNLRMPKQVFNSNYTPVIFSLKFLLHRTFNLKPCNIQVEEVDLSKTKRSKKKVKMF
ncbi:MAG: hypothetical protein V4616_14505 [Bacteroidota bacterium]